MQEDLKKQEMQQDIPANLIAPSKPANPSETLAHLSSAKTSSTGLSQKMSIKEIQDKVL